MKSEGLGQRTRNAIRRSKKSGRMLGAYCVLVLVCGMLLFPLYWIVAISLKTRPQIFARPPLWLWQPTFENYQAVLGYGSSGTTTTPVFAVDFLHYLLNSIVVSTGSVVVSLLLGVPAAYAFARYRFVGSASLLGSLLLMRMLPPIAVLVPMYVLFRSCHLLDTHAGLVLAYTTFNVPFVVWVMSGFFQEMPKELEESALIDGCSRFGAFWRVVLPLARPGLVAAAIFALVLAWNDFLFAVVLTSSRTQTLPVMMAGFSTDVGIAWGEMAASATLVIFPVLGFSLLTQRHLVRGLSAGAVKG